MRDMAAAQAAASAAETAYLAAVLSDKSVVHGLLLAVACCPQSSVTVTFVRFSSTSHLSTPLAALLFCVALAA